MSVNIYMDRLCGLVVSVEDYKHRGAGFDSRALLRIFLRELGLERGSRFVRAVAPRIKYIYDTHAYHTQTTGIATLGQEISSGADRMLER
jgi:hypothetical protein